MGRQAIDAVSLCFSRTMPNLLIIGYGNPLRGDDGVGWHVVDALDALLPEGSAVAIHQLTPEWAEAVSQAQRVIFIDATEGDQPGLVQLFPIEPSPVKVGSHEMTPGLLLSMASDLYGHCPPATMVTIVGGSFELSESLTGEVAAAVPIAISRILDMLNLPTE